MASGNSIYADYNGSAPLKPEVMDYLRRRFETGPFANPNSIHSQGAKILMAMENARSVCAKNLGADASQVIFTSGATEGISTVFNTLLCCTCKKQKPIFITSGIEHSAIVNTAKYYEKHDELTNKILPVKQNGVVDVETLELWLKEFGGQVAMVEIMAANNETGVIQPVKAIAELCRKHSIPFFSDTTQYIGKTPFHFKESGMEYAVMSGHKTGALPGTGILLAKDPSKIKPIIIGGGQERGIRGGTQNYLGNETLAVALEATKADFKNIEALTAKRNEFEVALKKAFPKVVILGEDSPRLATTTYVAYPGLHGQAIQIELESRNIFISTSSACSDNEPATSKVLKAMGVSDDIGRGAVRISLGLTSPPEYYDQILKALLEAYAKLSKIRAF